MKKLKVVILSALVMTGLAGCGDEGGNEPATPVNPEPQHTHKFSSEWSSNETQHWHAATCEHTELKANVSNHVDANHDGKCDECLREGLAVQHTEDPNKPGFCICGEKISVVAVELDTSKAKLVYAPNERLETTGVKLTATYLDGSKKDIEFTPSSVDMSTLGEKEVTLTYNKEDAAGSTGTIKYTINVSYWSEDEIKVIQSETYLGLGGLTLPYLPGFKIDYTESEESIESWYAFMEDATTDDFTEYCDALEEFNAIKDYEGDPLLFRFTSVSVDSKLELEFIESEYGFADGDFAVYRLAPLCEDEEGGEESSWARYFVNDEYFIIGFNQESELRIYDRYVSSYLDYFFGYEDDRAFTLYDISLIEKYHYTVAQVLGDIGSFANYYFSEFAADCIPAGNTTSKTGLVLIQSEHSMYPFDPILDTYALAPSIDIMNAVESDYTAFINELLDAGYVQDVEDENVYTFDDQYAGHIAFKLYPFDEHYVSKYYGQAAVKQFDGFDSGYGYSMYYQAPERGFISMFTPEADRIIEGFGELASDVEFEASTSVYHYYNEEFAYFTVEKTESPFDQLTVINKLIEKLPEGYWKESETFYDEEDGTYYLTFTNGVYCIDLTVYEEDRAGNINVELGVYECSPLATYTAEIAAFGSSSDFDVEVGPAEIGYVVSIALQKSAYESEIHSLEEAEVYIVDKYVSLSGLVAPAGDPVTDVDAGTITVATTSLDGKVNVIFVFSEANVDGNDCYVCQIFVYNVSWSGTAEEGFAYVATALKLPEKYWDYLHEGIGWYGGFQLSSAEEALELTYQDVVNALPEGVEIVSEVYDDDSGMNIFIAVSADGLITFEFQIGCFYEDKTYTTLCTVIVLNVYDTPAE